MYKEGGARRILMRDFKINKKEFSMRNDGLKEQLEYEIKKQKKKTFLPSES